MYTKSALPLKEVRKKKFTDKLTWFNSLSFLTKQSIHDYHLHCYLKHTGQNKGACPIESPKNSYDKKEGDLGDTIETLPTTFRKDFSFVQGKAKKLCKVKEYIFGAILCGESHTQRTCRHQYAIGENIFCSSPERKDIYKKHHI